MAETRSGWTRRLRAPLLCLLAGAGGCLALAPAERRVDLDELRLEALQDVELEAGSGTVRATGEDPQLGLRRLPRAGRTPPPAIGLAVEVDVESAGDATWELFYVPAAMRGGGFVPRNAVKADAEPRAGVGTALP